MADWVTTIIGAITSFFTTLYTVIPNGANGPLDATNPILMCILIPVVSGVAAFCVRLAKRSRK